MSSLVAQNTLGRNNNDLQQALGRLSTGLRINSGSDDPAGLIASENLRRDITAVNRSIQNSERAGQLIATADSALGQVSSLLNDIRGLVTEAANSGVLSDDQIAATQLQVDSSLEAIDRISQVTTFQGRKLLDGSLDFIISAKPAAIQSLNIQQANLGATGSIAVSVTIDTAAAVAQVQVTAGGFNVTNQITDDLVVQIAGADGAEVFSFASGATVTQIVSAVNLVSDATGVTASTVAGVLNLDSSAYGSDAFVAVEIISEGHPEATPPTNLGTFSTGGLGSATIARDEGADISATVNGIQANGRGNTLSINSATLDLSLTVVDGTNTAIAFTISDGGAVFQLGPEVVSNQQARIGIGSVNTGSLGGNAGRLYQLRSGQSAALNTDTTLAASIVDEVITDVVELRGRLGAFQRTTLQSNIASLSDTLVNLTAAESSIRDADFAKESAALTRAQILVQSGTSVLAIANQNPQNVLSLLR
ncbi:MAG: flagellin [Planctomycetota bacterium]|nr:flagellin [Planctomycetota bacterium]